MAYGLIIGVMGGFEGSSSDVTTGDIDKMFGNSDDVTKKDIDNIFSGSGSDGSDIPEGGGNLTKSDIDSMFK